MDSVRIGIGVIIRHSGKILVGLRKSKHGAGTYCFAGGHLEVGETIFDCAKREVREETGLEIKNLRAGPHTEDFFPNKHYLTLFVIADSDSGEPELREPEKFAIWEWRDWNNLPEPLFLPIANLLKQNFNPFTHTKL